MVEPRGRLLTVSGRVPIAERGQTQLPETALPRRQTHDFAPPARNAVSDRAVAVPSASQSLVEVLDYCLSLTSCPGLRIAKQVSDSALPLPRDRKSGACL